MHPLLLVNIVAVGSLEGAVRLVDTAWWVAQPRVLLGKEVEPSVVTSERSRWDRFSWTGDRSCVERGECHVLHLKVIQLGLEVKGVRCGYHARAPSRRIV